MHGANRADGKRPQTVITLAVPDDSVYHHALVRIFKAFVTMIYILYRQLNSLAISARQAETAIC